MAKLPSNPQLTVEDFATKDRSIVSKIAFVVNPFFNSVINALNKNLTINDNFNAQDTYIEFNTPVSLANPVLVKSTLKSLVKGSQVIHVQNLTDSTAVLTGSPFIEFINVQDNNIKITNITGLTTGTKYRLRVIFYP